MSRYPPPMAPTSPTARTALRLLPAAASGAVSFGLLLSLPLIGAADPALGLPRPGGAAWWTVAAVLVAQAVALVGVGRFPTAVLPGLAALPLVPAWVTPGPAFSLTAVAELAGVFLAVVARPSRRTPWVALAATALLLATGQFLNEVRSGRSTAAVAGTGAVAQALVVVGLPLLLGLVVAAQRATLESRRAEVAALRREQDALLQAAVSRQRVAMSRELHDIAAHHMSGIALMAAAIARQIDVDPAAAKDSARHVREQSRAVLDDLRRLVGLLREDVDVPRPIETLEAVAALVGSRRAAGARIDLRVPVGGRLPGPGPLAQLVAYRMVQESLANAAEHAPGAPCTVEIDVGTGGNAVAHDDGDRAVVRGPGPRRGVRTDRHGRAGPAGRGRAHLRPHPRGWLGGATDAPRRRCSPP
jgi:signal transduction histidine kinase